MKRLRPWLTASLVSLWTASLAAQTPTVAPAPMPPSGTATPIAPGEPDDFAGYGPAQAGYSDVEYGGYADSSGEFVQTWGGGGLLCLSGRGYVQVDAMLLNRNDAAPVPLVQDATGVVLSAREPYFGFETLPRLTTGYVLPNDTAIEATFFYKDDFDANYGVTDPTGGLEIIDPLGTLGGPEFDTAGVTIATQIHNFELNLVETGRIFNWIAGFRYLEIQDRMWLTASGTDTFSSSIETYNSLFGGQTGGRLSVSKGLFTWEGQGKAGLFFNNGNAASSYTLNGVSPGTVYTDGKCESFLGELSTAIMFRPTAAVAFRAGYQVMWICSTGLAPDQINTADPFGATQSFNDRGDLVLHGPSAGVDVRW